MFIRSPCNNVVSMNGFDRWNFQPYQDDKYSQSCSFIYPDSHIHFADSIEALLAVKCIVNVCKKLLCIRIKAKMIRV